MSSQYELDRHFTASALAAYTATGDTTGVFNVPVQIKGTVKQIDFVPSASITANGTNFTTLTVQNKGGNGSGTTAVASRVWSATNSTANTSEQFTLSGTPANLEVLPGDVLQVVQTHAGTGLAIPAASMIVQIQPHR